MKKELESIQNLQNLCPLNFRGMRLRNLDFISGLQNLRLLKQWFGSFESLNSFEKLSELGYPGISRTRKYQRQNADELHVDTNKIIASGNSDGGALVNGAALTDSLNEPNEILNISSKPNVL